MEFIKNLYSRFKKMLTFYFRVKRVDIWRIKLDILKDAIGASKFSEFIVKLKNKLFWLVAWCKLKLREISKIGKNDKKLENHLRRKSRAERRARKRRMMRRQKALKKCLLSGSIVFKAVECYSFGVTSRICSI